MDWGPIMSLNTQFGCVEQCVNNGQIVDHCAYSYWFLKEKNKGFSIGV
jgi:hypothetical protein